MQIRNKPLVSVIIPVYNREKHISDTLNNIKESTYRPIELVLVNDGSKDGSLAVLRTFSEENNSDDFRIRVLDQPNQGAPAARNHGFEYSKGDYVQFLDSDDLIATDKFHKQIELMERKEADLGLCDFEMIYPHDKSKTEYYSNAGGLKKVIRARGTFGCGSPLLKRELAKRISWNTQLKRHQDVDYFLKAALMAKKIAGVNESLYFYVQHKNERISDIYATTDPGYRLRIDSLKQLYRHRYNWFYISLSIYNLSVALIRYNIKSALWGNNRPAFITK